MKKFIWYIENHRITSVIIIILILLFSLIIKIYKFNFKYENNNITNRIEVVVQNLEDITENKVSYIVKYNGDKFILNIYKDKYSKLESNINKEKYSSYKYGDVLSLRGKILIPEKLGNPYEFDYKKHLNSKNIVGTITTYETKIVNVKIINIFIKQIYNLKEKISYKINNIMPEKEAQILKSMLYGDDIFLDSNIKEKFEKSGISHLLAVSGSNISTFMFVISYISKKLGKSISFLFNIIVCIVFCTFCSFELSIVRASIFLIITNISNKEEISLHTYIKIFLSFLVILIYNPYCIFNVGLVMSYVCVISIIMFQSQIFSLFDLITKKVLNIKYVKPTGIKNAIYQGVYCVLLPLSIILSVQIFIFPIQIYFFNSFNLVTFLSNIIIAYIDNIFGIIGFFTLIFSFTPILCNILSNTSFIIIRCIIYISDFFSKFESFNLKISTPDIYSIIMYYFIVITLNYKKYILKFSKKQTKNKINICIKFIYALMILYILISYIYLNYIYNYVVFFNVEQGNMALIHYKRKNIVVDMGSTKDNLASNILLNYLNKKNIDTIDMVILTHFHSDHINGLNEKLLNEIKVKKVIYSLPKEDMEEYDECIKLLNDNKIAKLEVTKGENIKLDEININVISPDVNKKIIDEDIENANSIVILIKIEDKNLLFMGDATKKTEESILKHNSINVNQIDIYQVGHHGSKTSTLNEYISKLNINTAIISAKKKVYNHPAEQTLKTLSNHNIKIKITEKNGAIIIRI